ncbi:MAG: hypothetical protein JKY54_05155, partial [Flavobacteriales bacterium]|nr:hypothetical protein [Flavobacteriales bacterium]
MRSSLLIILLLLLKSGYSQNLTFTNQNLKSHLINENCVDLNGDEFGDTTIDLNNDGEIQSSEADLVLNLVIGGPDSTISSVLDLHQFTNLKRLTIWGGIGLTGISNLNLDSLQHIRISDHNSITDIDLSDLPNLNSIFIEGLNGLINLNLQNGSHADAAFSLFYTYFNIGCVDSIMEEYTLVAPHILGGGIPSINCATSIKEHPEENTIIYPNPSTGEITIETNLIIS